MPKRKHDTPPYLRNYGTEYEKDPRGAALRWFTDARFGLFLHYGLYSLLGRGPGFVQPTQPMRHRGRTSMVIRLLWAQPDSLLILLQSSLEHPLGLPNLAQYEVSLAVPRIYL